MRRSSSSSTSSSTLLLLLFTLAAICLKTITQAFFLGPPAGTFTQTKPAFTSRRIMMPFSLKTAGAAVQAPLPLSVLFSTPQEQPTTTSSSSTALTPDEEIMEALIKLSWDDLEDFSNQHYKYLIHPQFYMKLADRIYLLPTQEEQDEAAAKATKIWNRLLAVLNTAEEQRSSVASMLEKILAQAAEDDGSFLFPLAPERVEAVRAEVVKNLDRLDEGALGTLNGWVMKVQDDKDNAAMTEVLQKVFQFYAGGVLMRAKNYERPDSNSGSLIFLRNLLNGNPDDWDMILFNGLKVDAVCTVEDLTEEIGAMIQGVVLSLPEGSLTQRIQAEYLRELLARVNRYSEKDPRAF